MAHNEVQRLSISNAASGAYFLSVRMGDTPYTIDKAMPLNPTADDISKALTGAYLSSSGNAFSTRTASQIVQRNFIKQKTTLRQNLSQIGMSFNCFIQDLHCSSCI